LFETVTAPPYNARVLALFANPQHAGPLRQEYPLVLSADTQESASGARLRLTAGIVDERIAEMRFLAFACPHLIAAAEVLCHEREGGAVAGLSVFALEELMTALAVPVEKTGRILLLEDALHALWANYSDAG
jgi:NifU-like protein involved in Fe-S cluster formation